MNNEEIYLTKSSEETKNLARNFVSRSEILLRRTKCPIVLAFYGNLGSGKTTFIQGLAEGLGIKRRIISPTFIIVRHYKLVKEIFYHIDLYRIETRDDLLGLGIDEIINDKNNIVAVEWAEKMGDMLPEKRIELHFRYVDENKREITIKYL